MINTAYFQRQSYWPYLFGLGLLLLAGFGTYLTIKALGPSSQSNNRALDGKVPIPGSYKSIPAYTKITRNHLDWIYLDSDRVPNVAIQDLSGVLGRVLKKEKPAGYVFTERDFLPRGTKGGFTAGIPQGKRAFTIDASLVKGYFGLKEGDPIDIISSVQVKLNKNTKGFLSGTTGSNGTSVQVQTIARNASLVIPLRTRNVPTTSTSLTGGTQTRTRPVQEIVVAVTPSEATAISQILAMGGSLSIVPISGLASQSDDVSSANGEIYQQTYGNFQVIETFKGTKRTNVAVPVTGN